MATAYLHNHKDFLTCCELGETGILQALLKKTIGLCMCCMALNSRASILN
jgi:hypothetical protein